MNEPDRQILLRVDERVFRTLSKMAADLGRPTARYALELFEAAYAVRCGVTEDAPLAAAIEARGRADTSSSADVDETERLRGERDAARAKLQRLEQLEAWIVTLREQLDEAKLAAERVPGLETTVETLRQERDALKNSAATDARAQDRAHREAVHILEGRIGRLRTDYASLQEKLASSIAAEREMQDRAEAAEAALADRVSLRSEIAALQKVSSTLAECAAHTAPASPAPTSTRPVAPEAASVKSAKTTSKSAFIWKDSWGKGR